MDSIPVAIISHPSYGKVTKTVLRTIVADRTDEVQFRSLSHFHRDGSLLRLRDCIPAGIDSLEVYNGPRLIGVIAITPTDIGIQAVVR